MKTLSPRLKSKLLMVISHTQTVCGVLLTKVFTFQRIEDKSFSTIWAKKRIENEQHIHKDEIFSLSITHDFTMLTTSSRDGTAKILNPRDLSTVRQFVYGKPCRSATISPLFDDPTHQKFHILQAGGQDAQKVTTTTADQGGFEMKLHSIIF